MDISINVPKRLADEWIKENKTAVKNKLELLYRIPYCPKNVKRGDRCYVIINKKIVGYHIIKNVAWINGFICEVTNKKWPTGYYLIRKAETWVELKEPIKTNPHRGFRYLDKQTKKRLEM